MFDFDLPLITATWALDLAPGHESPCAYDWKKQRYCIPLKTIIGSAAPLPKLAPNISFALSASLASGCTPGSTVGAAVHVHTFDERGVAAKLLVELPVQGLCAADGSKVAGVTAPVPFGEKYGPSATWVVANVVNKASGSHAAAPATLSIISLAAHYSSGGGASLLSRKQE